MRPDNLDIQQRTGSYFLLQLGVLIIRPCLPSPGQSLNCTIASPPIHISRGPLNIEGLGTGHTGQGHPFLFNFEEVYFE